ncbi:MAG TPA: hypothetical protein VFD90_21430 [Gaiellales bacterium]|jgi:hypothetical protein|nr:hypothetical protein [Gaiellales bacterium]
MMSEPRLTSLAEHPSAATAIRRTKAGGGILGYGLVLGAGVMHGAQLVPALEHALVGGIVAYVLTWAAAVEISRRVLAGQARAAIRRSRAHLAEETTE